VERDNAPAPNNQVYERKKLLHQVLERAGQVLSHKSLLEGRDASIARSYVSEKRALKPETIEKFLVGWAPAGPTPWSRPLSRPDSRKRIFWKRVSRSSRSGTGGSLILSQPGDLPHLGPERPGDRIRRKSSGGCRPPGSDSPPKYLNSSDSAIFQKGKNLYGFYQGSKAVRQSEEALILEGYMDVIAAHQAGVENAVAPWARRSQRNSARY